MEIKQEFKSVPKPTLGSLKAGDVFLMDEKGLHDTSRAAYMVSVDRIGHMSPEERLVIRLTDGRLFAYQMTRQVTPVVAVLTLEVPFG